MTQRDRKELVRFDTAIERVKEFIERNRNQLGPSVVVVRDLAGVISLALDIERAAIPEHFAQELHQQLGGYSPGVSDVFLYKNELFAPRAIFEDEDALPLLGDPGVRLLDRQIMGHDWLRKPIAAVKADGAPRITFFGIKGGVGRSTALAVLASELARSGRKILVVDLDLESPGVGSTLLPYDLTPEFGVVDWLVEDLVGQAEETLLREMHQLSPLSTLGLGEIRVVPAGGKRGNYLAKLSRAYLDGGDRQGAMAFADRLAQMLSDLEDLLKPDVILLDSRAGIHDLSAITVTRLGATALLFAINSSQTWHGYDILLGSWRQHPDLDGVRAHLKVVASMIPETGRSAYLGQLREAAYRVFQERLYEEEAPGELEAFNYDVNDRYAPHYPLEINWNRAFQEYDPVQEREAVTDDQVQAAFGSFVRGVKALLGRKGGIAPAR